MSLKPTLDYVVPAQTARIANAAFPKGALCLQLDDHLGTIFQDQDFIDLLPHRGQPAAAPFRLALVTLLPDIEGLSDRGAANAVRSRLAWTSLLCLELEDPGFDFSVLYEFRARLLGRGHERRRLEKLLEVLKAHQWVKARVRAPTNSTHVLAAVRAINRLEPVIETLRAALKALATVIPEGVQQMIPVEWVERYGPRAEEGHLPEEDSQRIALAETVAQDGYALREALGSPRTPPWWRAMPAIEILRQVGVQNFHPLEEGGARWREPDNLRPGARYLSSPDDPEARYSKKRDHPWFGYQGHLTASCDDELPPLLIKIQPTPATTGDNDALPALHQSLERTDLLPDTHLVDTGYMEVKRVVESRDDDGVDLFGPLPGNHRWQFQQGVGFELSPFQVDWHAQSVTCPQGKCSSRLQAAIDRRGNAVVRAIVKRDDGSRCDSLAQCTSAAGRRRTITVKPQPLSEVLTAARARQQTAGFKSQYTPRAGIESSISPGVRAFGLRRSRYRGQAKTRLQHIAIAAAMTLIRLGAWFAGRERGKTRKSIFVRTMAPARA